MMEETPNERLRARRSGYAVGGLRARRHRRLRLHLSRSATTSTSGSAACSSFRSAIGEAPYEMQQRFVADLRQRGCSRGIEPHAISRRSTSPWAGRLRRRARAGARGRRCRRLRERLSRPRASITRWCRATWRRRDPGGSGRRPARGTRRRASLPERLAAGDWRGASRFGADPAVPVPRARRIDGVITAGDAFPEAAQLIIAYATGALSYAQARRRLLSKFPRVATRLARIALLG